MAPRRALATAALCVASTCVTLVALELALRVYHGELLDFTSELPRTPNRVVQPHADYDSILGWVPRAAWSDPRLDQSVGSDGFRSNGAGAPEGEPTVVVVGDSFTYGDEVADSSTWPARLARRLHTAVLNGGVFAYGIDQAVLRAERVLEGSRPKWVVLAFIRDDVTRAELSYYAAWKPYFQPEVGGLAIKNVPVPRVPPPEPWFPRLRRALGYSLLASALTRRLAPEWWYYDATRREHGQGVELTPLLMRRLDEAARRRGARLLVVGLATGGTIGTNQGMGEILQSIAAAGVPTLDLVQETAAFASTSTASLYMEQGHYGPELNAWVADRIAERLAELDPTVRGR